MFKIHQFHLKHSVEIGTHQAMLGIKQQPVVLFTLRMGLFLRFLRILSLKILRTVRRLFSFIRSCRVGLLMRLVRMFLRDMAMLMKGMKRLLSLLS